MQRRWLAKTGLLGLAAAAALSLPATAQAQRFGFGFNTGRFGLSYGNPFGYTYGYSPWYYGPSWGYSPGLYGSRWGYAPRTYSYGATYPSYTNWAGSDYYTYGPSSYYYSYPSSTYSYSTIGSVGSTDLYGQAPGVTYSTPATSYYDDDAAPNRGRLVYLNVSVPPEAEVWVEGARTQQEGTFRRFVSPPLQPGQSYTYNLTARWMDNGQVVTRNKSVQVRPGETFNVNFQQDARYGEAGNDRDMERRDPNRRDQNRLGGPEGDIPIDRPQQNNRNLNQDPAPRDRGFDNQNPALPRDRGFDADRPRPGTNVPGNQAAPGAGGPGTGTNGTGTGTGRPNGTGPGTVTPGTGGNGTGSGGAGTGGTGGSGR